MPINPEKSIYRSDSKEQSNKGEWLKGQFAHRGLHNVAESVIENSASAFRLAVEHGFGIECDLQLTKDGQWVVFHDKSLNRLTEHSGFVADHSLDQLTSMMLKGSKNDTIGTLTALFEIAKGNVPLLIEIKTHGQGWNAHIQTLIRELQSYQGPYALMSFNSALVEKLKHEAPDLICGLVSNITTPLKKCLPKLEPDFVAHDIQDSENKFLGYYQRKTGFPVLNWTIRNLSQVAHAQGDSHGLIFEGVEVKDYLAKTNKEQ